METIYKQINLDDFKSHVNGIIPSVSGTDYVYYDGTDTNNDYGTFICNWNKSDDEITKGVDYIKKYSEILNTFRNSIHLYRLQNINCGNIDMSNNFVTNFDYTGTTEDFINEATCENHDVYNENLFSTIDGRRYTTEQSVHGNCVILISEDDIERFRNLLKIPEEYSDTEVINSGVSFYCEAKTLIFDNFDKTPEIPYIPIPLLLTCNYADTGILTNYYDTFGDNIRIFQNGNTKDWYEKTSGLTINNEYTIERYIECSGLTKGTIVLSGSDITVTSKLSTLRIPEYYSDDEGKILPGIFKKYGTNNNVGKYFSFINGDKEEYTENDLVCGDDELISSGQKKYRTISVLSEIDKYNLPETSEYYFLVKYNNSSDNPMDIPYKKRLVLNKEEANGEFRGDFIKEITISNNIISFDYIIGAKFTNNTYNISTATEGIEYKESYGYEKSVKDTFNVDGFENVDYWYNKIDFDDVKTQIYNSEFNMTTEDNITNIQKIIGGDVWRMDGSVENTPVIKQDYLMGVAFDSKVELDVEINRGNAAAFERHLRLSECNSMQDLEEIGNNMYDL